MADRREGGEWVLCAEVRGEEGIVASIVWRAVGEDGVADATSVEHVTPSPMSFPNLTSYLDFRAFWRGTGGAVEED